MKRLTDMKDNALRLPQCDDEHTGALVRALVRRGTQTNSGEPT
jgi:hypothetical protein